MKKYVWVGILFCQISAAAPIHDAIKKAISSFDTSDMDRIFMDDRDAIHVVDENGHNLLRFTLSVSVGDPRYFPIRLRIAKWLIGFEGDLVRQINLQDSSGRTPLHEAVMQEDSLLVQFLMLHKANPNLQDHNGTTPLLIAVKNDNARLVGLLLRSANQIYLNLPGENGETILHKAAKSAKTVDVFCMLVLKGADQTLLDDDGNFPIDLVPVKLKEKILNFLKENSKATQIYFQPPQGILPPYFLYYGYSPCSTYCAYPEVTITKPLENSKKRSYEEPGDDGLRSKECRRGEND